MTIRISIANTLAQKMRYFSNFAFASSSVIVRILAHKRSYLSISLIRVKNERTPMSNDNNCPRFERTHDMQHADVSSCTSSLSSCERHIRRSVNDGHKSHMSLRIQSLDPEPKDVTKLPLSRATFSHCKVRPGEVVYADVPVHANTTLSVLAFNVLARMTIAPIPRTWQRTRRRCDDQNDRRRTRKFLSPLGR
jgi:hypothetical protein